MTTRTTQAAHELAAVLLAQAENLASDDLATVATAMTAVRTAARAVEASLTERGWGGGVLSGLGGPTDDPADDPDAADPDAADPDDLDDADDPGGLDENDEDGLDDDEPWVAPPGVRMTYQARYDYVVVEEETFLAYVARRAAEVGGPWTRDAIAEHSPALVLAHLEGFASRDFEGTGMVFAGGQESTHPVPSTLWELDDEARDDLFPTSAW